MNREEFKLPSDQWRWQGGWYLGVKTSEEVSLPVKFFVLFISLKLSIMKCKISESIVNSKSEYFKNKFMTRLKM